MTKKKKKLKVNDKLCPKCNNMKPFYEFNKQTKNIHGLQCYCKSCQKQLDKDRFKKNKQKEINRTYKYRAKNPEKIKEINRRSRLKLKNDPLKYNNYLQLKKEWCKNNLEKINFYGNKRRSAKLLRMPKWLTKTQLKQIEDIYLECKIISEKTGIKHHVDHIIPLQGKIVSGLHVP